jgi:hypothetical protein
MTLGPHKSLSEKLVRVAAILICFIATTPAFKSHGVVDANSQSNTNPPSDGAPWGNMGHVNGSGGTYLANGWVLTASHVGAGNIDFGGTTFLYDGLSYRLTNSWNDSNTDIVMFHLSTIPNLPPMQITTSTPAGSSLVDLIGFGFIAGTPEINVGPYTGFYWSGTQFKSWGNNRVDNGGNVIIDAGFGELETFVTIFDSQGPNQTSDEAQAAPGDSGGGVFQKTASGWQFVGMIDAVGPFNDQPPGSSVYTEASYLGDIATYRSQILSIINTTPPVLTINRSKTNVMVCWANTGISHTLQAVTNLAATNWTTVPQAQVPTNGQLCVTIPSTNSARFFRLHFP